MLQITACIVLLVALLAPIAALAVDDGSGSSPQDYVAVVRNAISMEGAGDNIDQEMHYNDELTQSFINLLKHDFRTNAFNRRSGITLVNFRYTIDEANLHFAVAVISFPDSKSAERALKAAKAVGREHFIIKILTYFRVFQMDRDFIIILSETVVSPHTRNIIDRLTDDFAKTGQQ